MLGKDENNYLIILGMLSWHSCTTYNSEQLYYDLFVGLTVIPRKNEEIPRHIQVYSVEKFETHEKFDKYDFDYDIALVSTSVQSKYEAESGFRRGLGSITS